METPITPPTYQTLPTQPQETSPNPMLPRVETMPPVMPPSKPASSKSWIWFVLLGIVVLAGAAYAWLWLYPSTPVATPTPSPTASATPDPTAGWKIYRNEPYGFEFTYSPERWLPLGSEIDKAVITKEKIGPDSERAMASAVGMVSVRPRRPTAPQNGCFGAATENFKGYQAARSTRKVDGFTRHTIAVDRSDIGVCLDVNYETYDTKSTPIITDDIEKMLSSFTFVTNGWSKYQNAQYSFGLLYPSNTFTLRQTNLPSNPDDWQGDQKIMELVDKKGDVALDAWIVTSKNKVNVDGAEPAVVGISGRWNGAPGCGAYFTEAQRNAYMLRIVHYTCGNIFGVEQSERDKLVNTVARQFFWFSDRVNQFPVY